EGSDPAPALDLYRGDLLDGLNLEAEAYDAWLREQRTRFHNLATQLFERCSTMRDHAGDADGALAAAERLVDLDAGNEAARRRLTRVRRRPRGRSPRLPGAGAGRRNVRGEFDGILGPETRGLFASRRAAARGPAAAPAPAEVPAVADTRPEPQASTSADTP